MAGQKKSSVGEMLYDPENKTFLGRDAASWGKILGFYFIYYSFLAVLFYGTLAVYQSKLPVLDGNGPLIKSRLDQPGAGVWPHNDFRDDADNRDFNLIKNAEDYIEHSEAFVAKYEDPVTYSKSNIQQIYEPGNLIQKIDFAKKIEEGKPVVFIALNKLIGWSPINSGKMPENTPANSFIKDAVYFDCKNIRDAEIIDDFEVVPIEGTTNYIESKWYTFNPAISPPSGYKKPFVAMEVRSRGEANIKDGKVHEFKCAILADNIQGPPKEAWFDEQHPQAKVKIGTVNFGFSYV